VRGSVRLTIEKPLAFGTTQQCVSTGRIIDPKRRTRLLRSQAERTDPFRSVVPIDRKRRPLKIKVAGPERVIYRDGKEPPVVVEKEVVRQ
jgi:hypothetical protein